MNLDETFNAGFVVGGIEYMYAFVALLVVCTSITVLVRVIILACTYKPEPKEDIKKTPRESRHIESAIPAFKQRSTEVEVAPSSTAQFQSVEVADEVSDDEYLETDHRQSALETRLASDFEAHPVQSFHEPVMLPTVEGPFDLPTRDVSQ